MEKLKPVDLNGCIVAMGRCGKGHSTPRTSAVERLVQLVDQEWDERNNRAVERGLRNAKFR